MEGNGQAFFLKFKWVFQYKVRMLSHATKTSELQGSSFSSVTNALPFGSTVIIFYGRKSLIPFLTKLMENCRSIYYIL